MLKRKCYQTLLEWKNSDQNKCLVVEGARQIGKSYIIDYFGNENFKSFIKLDFIENQNYKSIFSGNLNVDEILTNITLYKKDAKIIDGSTLIFIDEIQECENALSALKYLAKDNRFKVICSGSALGMAFKNHTSYPVGSLEYLEMKSMDFEEFLWAMNIQDDVISIVKQKCNALEKIPDAIHIKMEELLRQYMIIGGMPEVVQLFVNTKDYSIVDKKQKALYSDYINDIARYANPEIKLKAEQCYKSIPFQLSKENHKFQYKVVEHKGTSAKFETSIDWLEHAHIIKILPNVKNLSYPLKLVAQENNIRIYPTDISFLISCFGMELKEALMFDRAFEENGNSYILDTNKGGLFEALACDMLDKAGYHDLYFYRNEPGTIEIEFLIEGKDSIVPIDIKAGRSKSRSLTTILENESIRTGYKVSMQNIGYKDKKVTLPIYALAFMEF